MGTVNFVSYSCCFCGGYESCDRGLYLVDYFVGMGTMEMAIVSSSNELPPVLLPAVYLLQSPIGRSKVL